MKNKWRSCLIIIINFAFLAFYFSSGALLTIGLLNLNFLGVWYASKRRPTVRNILAVLLILTNVAFLLTKKFDAIGDYVKPIFWSYLGLQSIGYVVDVLFFEKECLSYIDFTKTSVFFANIVSGPIENLHLLSQKLKRGSLDAPLWTAAIGLLINGLFKKILADRIVDVLAVINFNDKGSTSSVLVILLTSARLYCDFSGYTDIARGSAKIVGVDLVPNFNLPYLSKSLTEFWTKWHMSLGMWFKNYIFVPLNTSILRKMKNYPSSIYLSSTISVLSVFLLIGIWHSFSVNFIFWGIANATIILIEHIPGIAKLALPRFFMWLRTILVVLALQFLVHSGVSVNNYVRTFKSIFVIAGAPSYTLSAWVLSFLFLIVPHFFDFILIRSKEKENFFLWTVQAYLIFLMQSSPRSFIYGAF